MWLHCVVDVLETVVVVVTEVKASVDELPVVAVAEDSVDVTGMK